MDDILRISVYITLFMMTFTTLSVLSDGRLYALKQTAKISILIACVAAILIETIL